MEVLCAMNNSNMSKLTCAKFLSDIHDKLVTSVVGSFHSWNTNTNGRPSMKEVQQVLTPMTGRRVMTEADRIMLEEDVYEG